MSNNLGKNYISNTIYQLLVVIMPLFTMPHLARVLGANGVGTYSYNYSIVSYFVLFATLGTNTFAQREIAYHQDDREEVSRVFFETLFLRGICVSLSLLTFFIITQFAGQNKTYLSILSLNIINVFLDISWLYTGLEKFTRLAFRCVVTKILYLISIYIFITSSSHLGRYFLIEVLFTTIQSVLLWFGLRQHIEKVDRIKPFRHIKQAFMLFIPSLAIQLYTVLDKTMLGLFSTGTYAENGYYEQAQGIVKACLILITSMVTVLSPKVSYAFSKGRKDEMANFMYGTYRYTWFIAMGLIVVMLCACPIIIPLYLGAEFSKTSFLIMLSSPLFIIIGLSNVTGLQYFIPCNHVKSQIFSLLSGSAVNICLNLILIPRWQSAGAIIASVIAEFTVTTVQFCIASRYGDFKLRKAFTCCPRYVIAAGLSIGLGFALRSMIPWNWLGAILLTVTLIVTYLLTLIVLRDKMVIGYMHNLLSRIRTK